MVGALTIADDKPQPNSACCHMPDDYKNINLSVEAAQKHELQCSYRYCQIYRTNYPSMDPSKKLSEDHNVSVMLPSMRCGPTIVNVDRTAIL